MENVSSIYFVNNKGMEKTHGEIMYCFAVLIYTVLWIFRQSFYGSNLNGLHQPISYFCAIILLLKEIRTFVLCREELNVKQMRLFVVFATLFGLFFAVSESSFMFMNAIALLFIFSARDVPIKSIFKVTIISSLICLIIVMVSSELGIIQNIRSTDFEDGALLDNILPSFIREESSRNHFGFIGTFHCPTIAFNITAMTIYYFKEKISWLLWILLFIGNAWIFTYSQSRAIYFMAFCLLVFAGVRKLKLKLPGGIAKLFSFVCVLSFPVSILISYVLMKMWPLNLTWMNDLNEMFAMRISLAYESYEEYGIGLFGKRGIEWIGNAYKLNGTRREGEYNYVDSLYIRMLIRNGLIATIGWFALGTQTVIKAIKKYDYYIAFIFFLIATHSIIDDMMLAIYRTTTWIFMCCLFRDDNESLFFGED